jgi:hypothetical protein
MDYTVSSSAVVRTNRLHFIGSARIADQCMTPICTAALGSTAAAVDNLVGFDFPHFFVESKQLLCL